MPPEMYEVDENVEGTNEGRAGRLVFFGDEVSDLCLSRSI